MLTIFTTEDPKEVLRIQKATDLTICLWEITNNIRRKYVKYMDNITDKELSMAEDIFSDISHELDRRGINLDDLIE